MLLYMLARRHLLRGCETSVALPCLLTAGLIVAGFALAHIGMNLSWTGRAAISNLDWVHYSALCTAGLFAAQALLHFLSGRTADRLLLPLAAFLASLGAINLYVWETRDANAYVSTVALPVLREFEQSTARDAELTANQKARILATLGPVPNELDYERQERGTATVLDRGWLATYNASARRFASITGGPEARYGSSRAVHPVELNTRLDKQVFALLTAFLLVPFTLLAGFRRLLRTATRTTYLLFGAAVILVGTAGAAAFASPDHGLPLLLGFRGHSLTVFELLKLALVLVLALAFGHVAAGRDPVRRLRIGVGFAAAGAAIYLALSRDFGAGIALLALGGLMATLLVREADRITPLAVAAAVFACAPPVVGALDNHVPETLAARIGMWSEPWASYHRAELRNEVSRTLARIVDLRLSAAHTASPRAREQPAEVEDDVAKVSAELRFRADAVVGRASSARPLVPEPRSAEERLLFEAERLWTRLQAAGPAPTSAQAKASLRARVDAAIRELQTRAGALRSTRASLGRQPYVKRQNDQLDRDLGPDDFQIQRGLFALRKGGVLGTGLGRGKSEAVPGLSEDLPLVAVGETLGFAGLLLVALFVLLLTGRTLELACRRGRSLSGFLATGIGMLFGLQALISIGALAVALPFTGLTFPFLSRSGTALAGSFVAVGLIATVATTSQRPAHGDGRRAWFHRFPAAGFAAAFALVLVTVGVVQVTGRTATGGPFLAALPDEDAPFLHAQDPWMLPSYRSVAGPITDRSGRVLAKTTSMAGERLYPDRSAAATLAHTLVQLDSDFRGDLVPDTPSSPPVGPALVTTIDSEIQQAVDRAITAGVRNAGVAAAGSVRGAAVVLDSRSGAILAITSRPTFSLAELQDPATWAKAEALDRGDGFAARYLNRAVAAKYPPASTFKTITAAASLDLGLHALRSNDFDYRRGPQGPRKPDGLVHVDRWHGVELPYGPPITDANHPDLDNWRFNLIEAFAWSCNVAFGELGMELGPANLIGFARRFGFEQEIAIPGLGTSWSTVDDDWNKRADDRRLAQTLAGQARTAFGQEEVRATPLQMALVAAAIAHDGTIMSPHVVAGLRTSDGTWIERNRPRILLRTGLSGRTLAGMRTMMRAAVTYGLGRRAKLNLRNANPGVAGKTGSAEWSADRRALAHSWFIGYFPAEAPRVALAVVIERGGLGQRTAARVARMIVGSPALGRYVSENGGR